MLRKNDFKNKAIYPYLSFEKIFLKISQWYHIWALNCKKKKKIRFSLKKVNKNKYGNSFEFRALGLYFKIILWNIFKNSIYRNDHFPLNFSCEYNKWIHIFLGLYSHFDLEANSVIKKGATSKENIYLFRKFCYQNISKTCWRTSSTISK